MKVLKQYQTRVFLLSWLAYASIYFGRVNISVALPAIQEFFGYSKAQAGLIGSAFFWVYGIGHLINGQIGDRVQTRLLIFAGLLVTAISNLLFGFTTVFWLMLVLWMINAFAQSALWGPMVKSLSVWFSYESRSNVVVGVSTSMVGGYLLAWGVSGKIIESYAWSYVFIIPGVFIFIVSIIWYLFFKNHPNDIGFESPNHTLTSLKNLGEDKDGANLNQPTLREVFVKTKMWYIVIACFAQGAIKDGIALWAPTLFMETQDMSLASATQLILFIPVMNFLGMMAAAAINKRLNHQEKLTIAILFGTGIIMIAGFIMTSGFSTLLAIIFLGMSSAMMFGANTLLLGVIPMNYAKYNKASSVAGFLDFSSYMAAGITAFATGAIVDVIGWNGVLIFWIVCSVAGVTSLIMSWREDKINLKQQLSI